MDNEDARYEVEKLKRQIELNEWKAEAQKNKQTEIMAILAVLLFCAVAIILGLTGILD
jgi:hypothetical protein